MNMKKIIPILLVFLGAAVFSAQAQETKTKPVTTPTDKVHNVIHRHHKISHGRKIVHKSAAGNKTEAEVKTTKTEAAAPKKKTKKD
jgi:23S rRNA maturation mini-RNase III